MSDSAHAGAAGAGASSAPTRGLRRLVEGFQRYDRYVAGAEAAIAVLATFGMVFLVAAPMVLRKIPHETRAALIGDYSWMAQTSRLLLTWATFAGASLATRARGHIVVDIVTKLVPMRARAAMNVGAAGLAAVLCAVLAWVGTHVVSANWETASVVRGLSTGKAHVIIPVALAIMAARFLFVMLEDLDGAASGDLAYLRRIEREGGHGGGGGPATSGDDHDAAGGPGSAAAAAAPAAKEADA